MCVGNIAGNTWQSNIDARLAVTFHKAGLASEQDERSSEILKCTTTTWLNHYPEFNIQVMISRTRS